MCSVFAIKDLKLVQLKEDAIMYPEFTYLI